MFLCSQIILKILLDLILMALQTANIRMLPSTPVNCFLL